MNPTRTRPARAFDPAEAVAEFRRRYREIGSGARAAGEKAYLKSSLRFHGVTVPEIRSAAGAFARAHPDLDRAGLRALVEGLFATEFHDLRSTAIGILERKVALLGIRDLPWLAGLARRSGNWAHVDWLATKVVGPVIASAGARERARILESWSKDRDMWVRRTALLAQHDELRAGRGDFALFEAIAAPMLDEREFFIRKAIGWVLREVSKKRPELTFGFLLRHRERVSGLTLREGARRLPAEMRQRLG